MIYWNVTELKNQHQRPFIRDIIESLPVSYFWQNIIFITSFFFYSSFTVQCLFGIILIQTKNSRDKPNNYYNISLLHVNIVQ